MALLMALAGTLIYVGVVYGWRLARDPGVALPEGYGLALQRRSERQSLLGRLLGFLDRVLGARVLRSASNASRRKVQAAIQRAGRTDDTTYESVIARQATWAFLASVIAVLMLAEGQLVFLALPVAGWFFPRFSLWSAGRRRDGAIERQLPDFLDVMAVTISAGLGFRAALQRVSMLVGGPVSEEMLVALRQIDLGSSRRVAFSAMRGRSRSESLNAFVTAFLQAEELGAPIGEFLVGYAAELRRGAAQRARTQAARANPKISLVLTLVIMPALVIFMIGSIILQAIEG